MFDILNTQQHESIRKFGVPDALERFHASEFDNDCSECGWPLGNHAGYDCPVGEGHARNEPSYGKFKQSDTEEYMCELVPVIDTQEEAESIRKFGVRDAVSRYFAAEVSKKSSVDPYCSSCTLRLGKHLGLAGLTCPTL
jgi:hypothetical protein